MGRVRESERSDLRCPCTGAVDDSAASVMGILGAGAGDVIVREFEAEDGVSGDDIDFAMLAGFDKGCDKSAGIDGGFGHEPCIGREGNERFEFEGFERRRRTLSPKGVSPSSRKAMVPLRR